MVVERSIGAPTRRPSVIMTELGDNDGGAHNPLRAERNSRKYSEHPMTSDTDTALPPVRRIVTGHDAAGGAVVTMDG